MKTIAAGPARHTILPDQALSDAPLRSASERSLLSDEPPRTITLRLANGGLTLEVTGPEPGWLYPALDAFQRLVRLAPDWNAEGGKRIDDRAITGAVQFLAAMAERTTPQPSIVPTAAGGVQLEWHQSGLDVEIEFSPEGAASVLISDLVTGEEWLSQELSAEALNRAAAALARL